MPMITIFGIPKSVQDEILNILQDEVEEALAEAMGSSNLDVFHAYLVRNETHRVRPKHMIFATISTGKYQRWQREENVTDERIALAAKKATQAVAEAIYTRLGSQYTVEVFPPPYIDSNEAATIIHSTK